jgi:Ca2+-binding EF-hand superfamily protein
MEFIMSDQNNIHSKKSHKTLAVIGGSVLLAGAVFAGVSFASDNGGGWGHKMHGSFGKDMGNHMNEVFSTVDADQDGQLTVQEIETARTKYFTDMDSNNDSQIELAEFETALLQIMRPQLEKRFLKFDENGDGVISEEEISVHLSKVISRMDRNDDGIIEKGEIRKHHRKHNDDDHDDDDD